MEIESLEFFIGFVADKNLYLQIILGGVKIIKWEYFTAYLDTVILEKYVFVFKTLFFVFLSSFRRND